MGRYGAACGKSRCNRTDQSKLSGNARRALGAKRRLKKAGWASLTPNRQPDTLLQVNFNRRDCVLVRRLSRLRRSVLPAYQYTLLQKSFQPVAESVKRFAVDVQRPGRLFLQNIQVGNA